MVVELAIMLTIIIATVMEVFQVYRCRAFAPTTTARVLWIALVELVLLWLTASHRPRLASPYSGFLFH